MKNPIVLLILDGFGINPSEVGNAIFSANTPNIDRIFAASPKTSLGASGMDVGLPEGQMGNSEVGHTNIGAGRVVYQELTRITKEIADGGFFENPALVAAMDNCIAKDSALHLMGLLSDGGVHSHNGHLYALLKMAHDKGISRVFVHGFLDGRDVSPTSGKDFVAELVEKCGEYGATVATLMGRYYAMDRDKRWERVSRAYDAIVLGQGDFNEDPVAAMEASYASDVTDEFVEPTVCANNAGISSDDSVIFFNFRPDRAREITRTLVDPDFDGFERKGGAVLPHFVCFTQYDATMPNVDVAFKPQDLKNTLGEYVSACGMRQLRIAETEKYAHVTFFFNGGVEQVFPGEDRVLIPSPKVATYDLQPEMSAVEVTDEVCRRIASQEYDCIIANLANCDMVGHTGIFSAAVSAVETVDACVGRIVDAVAAAAGICLITADHGNADQMLEDDGVSPLTAHTLNPVPFVVTGADVKLRSGKLCDIAPTILDLLGLAKPDEMDGSTLILH
ncbi:MAG: 2,3-bisphosphoglycerate-independent phosphoglycerate mutase [Clostridia bacterium]|nr:2,3-bisphosphoglycerate-independent phosphoglycerate mutase [Clostridia bacterium]